MITIPKRKNIVAEMYFINLSGSFLPAIIPAIIAIPATAAIPKVEPTHTPMNNRYLAVSVIVAN